MENALIQWGFVTKVNDTNVSEMRDICDEPTYLINLHLFMNNYRYNTIPTDVFVKRGQIVL